LAGVPSVPVLAVRLLSSLGCFGAAATFRLMAAFRLWVALLRAVCLLWAALLLVVCLQAALLRAVHLWLAKLQCKQRMRRSFRRLQASVMLPLWVVLVKLLPLAKR
jgi:hypothetical protein